jgi:hypothetical protein
MSNQLLVYGLIVSLFLTEYWEIPIYLWRFINNGELLSMNGTKQIVVLLTVIMKLLVVMYLLYEIEILGWDKKDFFSMIIPFTMIYGTTTYVLFDLHKNQILHIPYFGWCLRIIVLGVFIIYTTTQMLKYPIDNLKVKVLTC